MKPEDVPTEVVVAFCRASWGVPPGGLIPDLVAHARTHVADLIGHAPDPPTDQQINAAVAPLALRRSR